MRQIFVHGLGQTPDSWPPAVSRLGDDFLPLCPSLPELAKGKAISYAGLYKGFLDVCNGIEGKVKLCGLSLGGVLALNYAIDYPEKVQQLVLIAAQYKMPRRLLKMQNVLFRLMPKSMFQQMGFGKKDFIRLTNSMMELDFSGSLQKVSCPVLLICGGRDRANQRASEALHTMLKDARLQIISGAGHEVNVDAPDELAKLLRAFFAERA